MNKGKELLQHVGIFWADGAVTVIRGRNAEETAIHCLSTNKDVRMVHCYHNHKVYFSEHTTRIN